MTYRLIDPADKIDWSFDWTNFLASGDSVQTSTWSIDPLGPSLGSDTIAGAVTSVVVEGAAAGVVYRLTNHMVTANGIEKDRSIALRGGQA